VSKNPSYKLQKNLHQVLVLPPDYRVLFVDAFQVFIATFWVSFAFFLPFFVKDYVVFALFLALPLDMVVAFIFLQLAKVF
jgi:hypothetical protein